VRPPRLPGGMAERCPPPYPRAALRDHIQGLVVLQAQVGPDGRPTMVTVARSSGFPILDNAALDALRSCRFEPATENGRPIPFRYEVPYRFRMEN